MVFTDWRQLCDKDKLADAVVKPTAEKRERERNREEEARYSLPVASDISQNR